MRLRFIYAIAASTLLAPPVPAAPAAALAVPRAVIADPARE
jgi:hypothetical protein